MSSAPPPAPAAAAPPAAAPRFVEIRVESRAGDSSAAFVFSERQVRFFLGAVTIRSGFDLVEEFRARLGYAQSLDIRLFHRPAPGAPGGEDSAAAAAAAAAAALREPLDLYAALSPAAVNERRFFASIRAPPPLPPMALARSLSAFGAAEAAAETSAGGSVIGSEGETWCGSASDAGDGDGEEERRV